MLEEPITFSEMYSKNMNKALELARLKKIAKEKNEQDLHNDKLLQETYIFA